MKMILCFLIAGMVCSAGTIVMMGSDTLGAKMVPQLKEAYLKEGHEVDFEIAAEGSSQAFTNLLSGKAQIGMSSRLAKKGEVKAFLDWATTSREAASIIAKVGFIPNQ